MSRSAAGSKVAERVGARVQPRSAARATLWQPDAHQEDCRQHPSILLPAEAGGRPQYRQPH